MAWDSWDTGDLAQLLVTTTSEHLTARQGGVTKNWDPFPSRPPTWLSTFGAAPSTALIPYGVFP